MTQINTTIINIENLSISALSYICKRDWIKINYAAAPYLQAMHQLNEINDNYMHESGKSIVSYFLSNSGAWRGEIAKQIKSELKRRGNI